MSKYGIVDISNLFHRARHAVRGDVFTQAGMTLNIVFKSLRKLVREYKVDHLVFCADGSSWRYKISSNYKGARKASRIDVSPQQKEEDQIFFDVMNDFTRFISEETRCTMLHSQGVEADDFVARWIYNHPEDDHVILSGDSDFIQLLAPNVVIYNGVTHTLLTVDGVFNEKNKQCEFSIVTKDGKVAVGLPLDAAEKAHDAAEKAKKKKDPSYEPKPYSFTPEPEWWRKALFVKIVRGDVGDSIFSSYPGVRYNGTTKKAGICEAWEDRHEQGYAWNSFMLETWKKIDGGTVDDPKHKNVMVRDEFKFNESLIDLTAQPEEIKNLMDEVIVHAVQKELVTNVGVKFLRFCNKHDLPRLAGEAQDHATYLNAGYK